MMETEIWPNLLRACHRAGVKTVLVNGRISSRSYPRYRLARPFFRRVLADVDRFCMQSEESARRIIDIGADPRARRRHRHPEVRFARVARRPPPRPIAAATACCATSASAPTARSSSPRARSRAKRSRCSRRSSASAPRCRNALLIIAPRKPERFDEVERLARARRLERRAPQRAARRRRAAPRRRRPRHHRRARAALPDRDRGVRRRQPGRRWRPQYPGAGGVRQANRVRSAHAELRRDRADLPRQRRGDPGPLRRELEPALLELLGDPVRRASLGAAARALVEANRGARGKSLAVIAAAAAAGSRQRPAVPACSDVPFGRVVQLIDFPPLVLVPCRDLLSALYAAVVASAARALRRDGPICAAGSRRPVISVGNLAVGGRGKTPLAASSRALLRDAGERPAILSRGYGRRDAGRRRRRRPRSGRHPRRSRPRRRRAADAGAAAPRRRRCWCRAIATWPAGSPSITSAHGPRAGRRVSAPAARSRRRLVIVGARGSRARRGRCRPAGCASRSTRSSRPTPC